LGKTYRAIYVDLHLWVDCMGNVGSPTGLHSLSHRQFRLHRLFLILSPSYFTVTSSTVFSQLFLSVPHARYVSFTLTSTFCLYLAKITIYEYPHYELSSNLLLFRPSWFHTFFTLFSNTTGLWSSLYARQQVSHSYKTRGRITFLYLLIFTFLISTQMDKFPEVNGRQSLTLNCTKKTKLHGLSSRANYTDRVTVARRWS
jgi:hypothetical protein